MKKKTKVLGASDYIALGAQGGKKVKKIMGKEWFRSLALYKNKVITKRQLNVVKAEILKKNAAK